MSDQDKYHDSSAYLSNLESALRANPKDLRIRRRLIDIYFLTGNYLCTLNANNPEQPLNLYEATYWWDRAVELWQPKAYHNESQGLRILLQASFAYDLMNNIELATKNFERAYRVIENMRHDSAQTNIQGLIKEALTVFGERKHYALESFFSLFGKTITRMLVDRQKSQPMSAAEEIEFWERTQALIPLAEMRHLCSNDETMRIKLIKRCSFFLGEADFKVASLLVSQGKLIAAVRRLNRAIQAAESLNDTDYENFIKRCVDLVKPYSDEENKWESQIVYYHFIEGQRDPAPVEADMLREQSIKEQFKQQRESEKRYEYEQEMFKVFYGGGA